MFGLKRKAMAAALSAAVLAVAVVPGLTPGALDNPPSTRSPLGIVEYIDDLFGGEDHKSWYTANNVQDTLMGDYPWRVQYYGATRRLTSMSWGTTGWRPPGRSTSRAASLICQPPPTMRR